MRILQWGPLPSATSKGGVEFYVKRLSRALSQAGHEVDICNFGFGGDSDGVSKHTLPPREEYDVVHVHMGLKSLGILSLLRRVLTDERVVFTVHIVPNVDQENVRPSRQYVKHLFGYEFNKILARHADLVTAVSPYSRRRCQVDFGVDAVVVPNAVDTERFSPIDAEDAWERLRRTYELPHPDSCETILYLGTLSHTKGVDMLVDAFQGVADEHPEARLVIGGDGEYAETLSERVEESRGADRTDVLGVVPDELVPPLYNYADVFCLPTRGMEGMPTVALEAMATGTPLVSTGVGGLDDILVDEETAVVVEPSVRSLRGGLNRLLSEPDDGFGLSTRSLEYVRDNFCWESVARRYEHEYAGVQP